MLREFSLPVITDVQTEKFLLERINNIYNTLNRQHWLKTYNGFFVINYSIFPYTLDLENANINFQMGIELDKTADPFQSLISTTRITTTNKLAESIVKFSTNELSKQKGDELMPLPNTELADFLREHHIIIQGQTTNPDDDFKKIFHANAISTIFQQLDFLMACREILSHSAPEDTETHIPMHKIIHNALGVYVVFNTGQELFNANIRRGAHDQFLATLNSVTSQIKKLLNSDSTNDHIDPYTTLSSTLSNLKTIYPETDIDILTDNVVELELLPDTHSEFFNIIFNLINNAWKYSLSPGAKQYMQTTNLEWKAKPIQVLVEDLQDYIQIAVADSGIPLTTETITALLTNQKVSSRIPGIASTGLGFPSIMASIQKLNGNIDISSTDSSKTFTVRIPKTQLFKD